MREGVEWNVVWIISIDLRTAFDGVESDVLSSSLHEQGINESYICLLKSLHERQKGVLSGSVQFNIDRGVRQNDILSPVVFNATLEQAMPRWKQRLNCHRLALAPDEHAERITNIPYR